MEHLVGQRLSGELDGLLRGHRSRRGQHVLLRGLRLLLHSLSDRLRRRRRRLPELLGPLLRRVLFALVFAVLGLVTAARIVSVAVPQSHVRPGLGLLRVDGPVQEVVDEVILRGLLTNILAAGRHADQVHLRTRDRHTGQRQKTENGAENVARQARAERRVDGAPPPPKIGRSRETKR